MKWRNLAHWLDGLRSETLEKEAVFYNRTTGEAIMIEAIDIVSGKVVLVGKSVARKPAPMVTVNNRSK